MSTRTLIRSATLAFGALTAACSPLKAVNLFVPEESYERSEGLSYGPEARHKLDVYQPAEPDPSGTVVVFIYGGAWRNGARQNYVFAGESFAARGYVTVVPDYRLYPEVGFPAFVEDAAQAVAWVRRRIAAYGGNPDRIILAGHSAGAHTVALLGLDRRYLDEVGVPQTAIRGVIGLAGPYSFDPTTYRSTREVFANVAEPADARPVSFVRGDAPPMLLLHGLDDGTVLPKNSEALTASLHSVGAEARYIPLDKVGHAGVLLALSNPFEGLAPVMREIEAFISDLPDPR